MGVVVEKISKQAPQSAKEKRKKATRPQAKKPTFLYLHLTGRHGDMAKKSSSRSKAKFKPRPSRFGSGTRLGATQEAPITIEDSEDEGTAIEASTESGTSENIAKLTHPTIINAPDPSAFHYRPPVQTPFNDPIKNLYSNKHGFTLKRAENATIPFRQRHPSEESLIFVGESRTKAAKNKYGFREKSKKFIQHDPGASMQSSIRPPVPESGKDRTPARKHSRKIGRMPSSSPASFRRCPYPTPSLSTDIQEREPSTLVRSARNVQPEQLMTMRGLQKSGQFHRLKDLFPDSYRYRSPAKPTSTVSNITTTSSFQSDTRRTAEVDMTLDDIVDFDLRKKVEHLMAVAPTLPICDLFALLIDMKGHFETARDKAFKYTYTQSDYPHGNSLRSEVIADDGREAKVKINLDDPDIYMDNHAHEPTPPPNPKRPQFRKPRKAASTTEIGQKNSIKTTQPAEARSASILEAETKPSTQKSKIMSLQPPNIIANIPVKRSTTTARSRTRANSIVRDFLASDDEIVHDVDGLYQDSLGTTSDNDYSESDGSDIEMKGMEDDDLVIDMRSQWAYNSGDLMNLDRTRQSVKRTLKGTQKLKPKLKR